MPNVRQVNAVLVDNQLLFAEGFTSILNRIEQPRVFVIETVTSAQEAYKVLSNNEVDLLFLELNLPDEDGIALIPRLKLNFPHLRICVVTSYTDHKFVKSALTKGADGFYSKRNDSKELIECVTEIMAGNTFLSAGLHITPPPKPQEKQFNGRSKIYEDRFLLRQKLTKREQEVLSLITKAMNNKEIAARLYISDQTVGVHRKNIMRKLGVRNTVNLIRFAIDHQLV